jgi:hypothetical protein
MLSKAPERAVVTDDIATTAASSCVGLMLTMCVYGDCRWIRKLRGFAGLRMTRGEAGRIKVVGAVVQREIGVASGCQQG